VLQLQIECGELDVHLAVVPRRHDEVVVAEDRADLVELRLSDERDALAQIRLVELPDVDALLECQMDARVEHVAPEPRGGLVARTRCQLAW
jgi:hypothetical protein